MTRPHTELHTNVVLGNRFKTTINNNFPNNIFEYHPFLKCPPNASNKFSHFQNHSDQDSEDDNLTQKCQRSFSKLITKQSSNPKRRFMTTYVMSFSLCFHGKMD